MTRMLGFMAVAAVAAGCTDSEQVGTEPVAVPLYALGTAPENFRTHVTGAEETPPKATQAQGQAILQLSADGLELHYKIVVADIENVTQSHIHFGPVGQAGPPVLWLYPSAPPAMLIPGRSQGVVGEGVATAADLVGPFAGQPLSVLVDALRAGNAYANVHTSQFPLGEIRGQID